MNQARSWWDKLTHTKKVNIMLTHEVYVVNHRTIELMYKKENDVEGGK